MTPFFIYILEVIACSALFTGYYWWVLRNGNFYHWNRLFINVSVVLSIVIPLLSISVPMSPNILQDTYDNVVNYISVGNTIVTVVPVQSGLSSISWVTIGFVAYLFVTFILLIKEFVSFVRIVRLKRNAEHIYTHETSLYYINNNNVPFTFFRTIFWGKDISPDSCEGPCMLRHELAHVRLGHSWDKALMQLVCCIFWMNPFFILMRRELEFVHEFEADHESLGEGNNEELSSLILSTMYPNHYHDFTSRFFQSSIKRRIFMITKSKKSKLSIIRKIGVIPVLLITLFIFSVSSEKTVASFGLNNTAEGIPQDNISVTGVARVEGIPENVWVPQNELEEQIVVIAYKPTGTTSDAEKITAVAYPIKRKSPPNGVFIYNDVEEKPKFKSEKAESEFLKFIAENINYPTICAENGIAGEVIVSYVIDENGKIGNIEAEVSIDPHLAREVTRALEKSSNWIPGKQNGANISVQCYVFTKFILRN